MKQWQDFLEFSGGGSRDYRPSRGKKKTVLKAASEP
jgi:hypothetical protein